MMFQSLPFHPVFIPIIFFSLMITVGIIFKIGPFARKESKENKPTEKEPQNNHAAGTIPERLKRKYERGEISREKYKMMVEEYYDILTED